MTILVLFSEMKIRKMIDISLPLKGTGGLRRRNTRIGFTVYECFL